VFYIPEKDKEIGARRLYACNDASEPFCAPARKMPAMQGKVRLDAKMEVCNNQQALLVLNNKRGPVLNKLKVHSNLMKPFWGW
jgi:hypothetical protein